MLSDAKQTCAAIPESAAREAIQHRLEIATTETEDVHEKSWWKTPFKGWAKNLVTASVVLLLALIAFSLNWILTPSTVPLAGQPNFRLLISDEENNIADFNKLEVTISSIGLLNASDQNNWNIIEVKPNVVVDLTRLLGLNAQNVWSGHLPEGHYASMFIDVKKITGEMKADGGKTSKVSLPGGRFQISKPFIIAENGPLVNYVYDLIAVKIGQDSEYILQTQVECSGANQVFHEVGEGDLVIRVIDGPIIPGEAVLLSVTTEGVPVAEAKITVNGEKIGFTDGEGYISFVVPYQPILEIEAFKGELFGVLKFEFEEEYSLTIEVVDGTVIPGETVVLLVSLEEEPVNEAKVKVNGDIIGYTDSEGLISFEVPYQPVLEIEAFKGELYGELRIEL